MTTVAINLDVDDIHFANQADPSDEYGCPECRKPADYVRSHERELQNGTTTQVRPHFRLSNCSCGAGKADHDTGGGGGAGGGETPLHKRRKLEAMNEATTRFETDSFDTEVHIGEKRADAVVEFAQPHETYGKGLVIEYQHKNEQKDIAATEKHFAEHEYTTLWLWEEQFSFEGVIPEIELFGGRVYTPWPDAVPPNAEWQDSSDVPTQILRGLISDLPSGHSTTETPIPAAYWDDHARKLLDCYWERLFSNPLSERYVDDISSVVGTTVPAKIPTEYIDEHARDYWKQKPWSSRFNPAKAESYIDEVRTYFDLPSGAVPVTLPDYVVAKIKRRRSRTSGFDPVDRPNNPFDDVQCWQCGHYWYVDNGKEYTHCPKCDERVDFEWNLETGRISEMPSYV